MAAGDLTTLTSVRSFLRISDTTQTAQDALLETFITQASKAIRTYCGQDFEPIQTTSTTRVFAYYGGGRLYFAPHSLRSVTSVAIDTETDTETTLTADSDYFLFPRGGSSGGVYEFVELRGYEPGARLSDNAVKPWREVTITGLWGFEDVPADVVLAANVQVAWMYRNFSAPPGQDLAGEGDRFGPVGMPSGVRMLLEPYRIVGFGDG